jgi:hypothetical protein
MGMTATEERRFVTSVPAGARARTWDIPVPPYDQELPPQYWAGLKTPLETFQRPRTMARIPWMEIWNWARTALLLIGFLGLIGWLCSLRPKSPLVVHTDAEVAAMHPTPDVMVPGNQYWVVLPDARKILINFKGTVDHACNLPKQPPGGANNAMYTETATGNNWIWTVPIGASNTPQWIDP